MRAFQLLLLLSVLPLHLVAADPAAGWSEADFESIASGLACPARIALRQDASGLSVALEIAPNPGTTAPPAIALGAAAAAKQILAAKAATPGAIPGWYRFSFQVPAAQLARSEAEWAQFRFAAAATFPGTIAGQPLYRVRYRHQDGRAMHSELSPEPRDWAAFDLNAYRQRVSDRKARVILAFDQPLNGKGTIVIDDANGNRVRNLISGRPYQKGRQTVDWDLLDDHGVVVPPGTYTWRSLHHAGIVPEYRFSFCNDGNPPWKTGSGDDMWGPDHSCFTSVVASGEQVFFLSPCAEAGYNGAVTDLHGVKHQTWGPPTPVSKFLLASDGKTVFAAADDGKRQLLVRYEAGKGWNAFGNGQKEIVWGSAAMNGFGTEDASFSAARWDAFNLAGLAVAGNRLAVASRADKGLIIFDTVSGNKVTTIPLPDIGAVASLSDGSLLVVSSGAILRLAPGATTTTPFVAAGKLKPGAMAASADGRLYVIDEATSQIAILNAASGKETGRLGKPGGAYAGTYDTERMVRPLALALAPNGWLWVTENRFNPKRVLAWDVKTAKVVKEKFGSTSYGASGGGMDSTDATRWIGQGAIWKIDIDTKTAKPLSVLFADAALMPQGMHWRFHRRDGRTFLLGFNGYNSVVELKSDGSGRLLAQYGSAQAYALGFRERLPAVFLAEFYRQRGFDTPEKLKRLHEEKYPHGGEMYVWSDVDGDGQMQAPELEFNERHGSGYWGADVEGLDIVMPLSKDLGNRPANWRLDLPLLGWHPSGAPKWQPLAEAQSAAKPTLPAHYGNESALADRNGMLYLNAKDDLMAYGPDAVLRWTYPNHWAGVHGSHEAPLPSPGQLQGSLFFLGNAPLDDGKTDVFVINGNHGRFFALTSDGFYLDEFFKDVRMGAVVDAYLIGGECFGGSFIRGNDKRYYLQSGHTDYRIFTMRGFESIVRGPGGTVQVTPPQIEAADRRTQAAVVAKAIPAAAAIARLAAAPALDGSGTGWPEPIAAWKKSGRFPAQIQAGWDATNLYLRWSVEDASPWSNHGGDDKMLFKSGDSVDIQLGTDPGALANRTGAVPGDIRLLIAPFQGKPIAMLYRHRVPGTTTPVPFASPWRTENVDVVRRLDAAKLNVAIGRDGRYVVEAAIPLADLGLKPVPGRDYRADFGAIFGDPDGQMNQLRSYWSNQATGLVNDVPGEIMLFPNTWGTIRFLEGK